MNYKQNTEIHVQQIENLELQQEAIKGVEKFQNMYKLKNEHPNDSEVMYYSLSEIQSKINENKDILNELQNVYKELHNQVNLG